MITRLWRAHASHENADAFEDLFRTQILPAILGRRIAGLKKATMLRRDLEDDVEFCALFWFRLDRRRARVRRRRLRGRRGAGCRT